MELVKVKIKNHKLGFLKLKKNIIKVFLVVDQMKKKGPCQRVKDDETRFVGRQRSASLSPELFKLGLKNNTFDIKKTKEEFLGSTVSSDNFILNIWFHASKAVVLTSLSPSVNERRT